VRHRALALTIAIVFLGTVFAASPAAAARRCFGKLATIVGTNKDPGEPRNLHGTPGDDVIVGLNGWDLIDGLGGNDLICSGGADDYIKAGKGKDKVDSAAGLDTVYGDRGNDILFGGKGPVDSVLGGPGDDELFGGLGGEDSLIGGPGDDAMDGGPGYDLAEFWDSPVGVEADLETDVATGHGNDTIVSIEGLVGSSFDDILSGDDRSNMLQGSEGDDEIHARGSAIDGSYDLIRSGIGEDILDGGPGPDRISYNLSPFTVEVDLSIGEATSGGGFGHDTLISIEDVVGSKYDDTLIGDNGPNTFIGNGGDDVMDGRGGIDVADFADSRAPVTADLATGTAIAEGWGNDTLTNFESLFGSVYPDELTGDDGTNELLGGNGADVLSGSGGDDSLVGESGNDRADGGAGFDSCDAETEVGCESVAAREGLRAVSARFPGLP
jgi:Ca2+-binding RTX toxin-like protein